MPPPPASRRARGAPASSEQQEADAPHVREAYPRTPDGRYFVVRGRLWRLSDPRLEERERARLVSELMSARRAVRDTPRGSPAQRAARARVDAAKRALGERGAVWWDDGAPDESRRLARNSSRYAHWFAARAHTHDAASESQ